MGSRYAGKLLTLDNGVVAAPVKENTGRRLRTAVDLIPLRVGKIQRYIGGVSKQAGGE